MIYTLNEYTHLKHHGIENQRWGDRNGPPYPLEPDQMTAAQQRANANEGWFKRKKREAAEKKEAERQAKIAEKERKIKAKKLKNNLARAARKYGLNQEKKNEIIRKGDVAKAHKYKDAFSQKEIADLLERKRLNDMLDMEVSKISQRQKEDGIRKFETMGRYLNTVVGVGKAGVDLYNIYAGVSNALMGTNKSLISLNPGDRNKDKNKDKNNKDKNNDDSKGDNKSKGKNQPASIVYQGPVDRRNMWVTNDNRFYQQNDRHVDNSIKNTFTDNRKVDARSYDNRIDNRAYDNSKIDFSFLKPENKKNTTIDMDKYKTKYSNSGYSDFKPSSISDWSGYAKSKNTYESNKTYQYNPADHVKQGQSFSDYMANYEKNKVLSNANIRNGQSYMSVLPISGWTIPDEYWNKK